MTSNQNPSTLPRSFVHKKSEVLSSISTPADLYTDRSPKGSIDAPIIELIDEINAIEGLVTTSSCSGRVAVFVEGPKTALPGTSEQTTTIATTKSTKSEQPANGSEDVAGVEGEGKGEEDKTPPSKAVTGSPAGKGGGHWLYVSHDPVEIPESRPPDHFTRLCGLTPPASTSFPSSSSPPNLDVSTARGTGATAKSSPRLVKLIFSPLILHVLCATLHHAKPSLAAAINAGFRESGVQSLKALDDVDAGTMVGIRTNGLGFESVVGFVREDEEDEGREVYVSLVGEEVLGLMFDVVNERFKWNLARRERLREEIRSHFAKRGDWEDREARRRRKREEGLRRKRDEANSARRKEDHFVSVDGDDDDIGNMFEETAG